MLGKTTSERKKAQAESKKAKEAKESTHKEFLDAKQNRIEAENAAKQEERDLKDAQRRAEAEAKARKDLEKEIEEEEKRRKIAKAKKKALEKKKLTAEELAMEEARKRQEAKDRVKRKAEKRRKRAEEERQRKMLAASEAEQLAEVNRLEVEMRLNDLKTQEGTMAKEDYILARINIKAITIDFEVIGEANGHTDDLQQIDGIDEGLERRLNTLGISTLSQISKMDDDMSDVVNDAIEYMPGRIRRQLWAEQAQILLE